MARQKFQREADLLRIAELYLKRKSQAFIGAELGLTQQTVSNDIREIERRWLASALRDFDVAKSEELARIDEVERQAQDAWERSCGNKTVKTVEQIGSREKKSLKQEKRDGNPAFLQLVLQCIERRCKLLGLDAPAKHEHSGPNGTPERIIVEYVNAPPTDTEPAHGTDES
jgi:hypothetical protein